MRDLTAMKEAAHAQGGRPTTSCSTCGGLRSLMVSRGVEPVHGVELFTGIGYESPATIDADIIESRVDAMTLRLPVREHDLWGRDGVDRTTLGGSLTGAQTESFVRSLRIDGERGGSSRLSASTDRRRRRRSPR